MHATLSLWRHSKPAPAAAGEAFPHKKHPEACLVITLCQLYAEDFSSIRLAMLATAFTTEHICARHACASKVHQERSRRTSPYLHLSRFSAEHAPWVLRSLQRAVDGGQEAVQIWSSAGLRAVDRSVKFRDKAQEARLDLELPTGQLHAKASSFQRSCLHSMKKASFDGRFSAARQQVVHWKCN